jgi:hypothetical protein
VWLLGLWALGALGAGEPQATLINGMEPMKVLERAYAFLQRQPAFSVEAVTVNEDPYRKRMVMEVRHRLRIDLERPGKLRVRIDGDSKHRDLLMEAGHFLIWDRVTGLYGELKTPETVDGTLDYLYDKFGITTPLANLLYSDLTTRLRPKARGVDFGLRLLDGVWCRYLGFANADKELQVWIRSQGDPLIQRFVLIDKTTPLRLHSATTLHWLSVGKVTGKPFALKLPASAHRIPIEPAP